MADEKVDANDFAARHGPDALADAVNGLTKEADEHALFLLPPPPPMRSQVASASLRWPDW